MAWLQVELGTVQFLRLALPPLHTLCIAHDHVWVTDLGPRRAKSRVLEPDTQADNLCDLRQVTCHLCVSTSLSLRESVYPLHWALRYLNEVICVKCLVNDVLKKHNFIPFKWL